MFKSHNPTILQVIPQLRSGGAEKTAIDVATAVMDHGWHAIVASAGGPLTEQLVAMGIDHVNLPLDSKNPVQICVISDHGIHRNGGDRDKDFGNFPIDKLFQENVSLVENGPRNHLKLEKLLNKHIFVDKLSASQEDILSNIPHLSNF